MLKKAQQIQQQLSQWRRTIHRQPELGFDVYRTAGLVAQELSKMGIEVQTGVGKSGVVAHLGSGEGPTIAIRADMDALPIQEANPVEYASEVEGRMHACGHDAHTAILMGVAHLLNQEELPGRVRLIFQPSEEVFDEEGISGAPRMIADGALEDVQAIIALHVDGTLDAGMIAIQAGPVGAAVDTFKGVVVGKGGHGAYPHQSIDPIWLSTHVLNALYAIPSRRINPLQPCVVTVGVIQAGSAENVIPYELYIEGTLRSYDGDVRETLLQEVERAFALTRSYDGDYRMKFDRGYPVNHNNPEVTTWIQTVGADLLSADNVLPQPPTMGAEDFGYMTQSAPGAMLRLGVKDPAGEPRYLHTPTFDLDETALPVGAAVLAETALRFTRNLLK